jgi:hypothetical protein
MILLWLLQWVASAGGRVRQRLLTPRLLSGATFHQVSVPATSQGADSAVPDWEEKISTNLLNRIQQSKGRASFFDAG